MTQDDFITDEVLGAFIDKELDEQESNQILTRLNTDKALADRLNEMRYLKELVRAARPETQSQYVSSSPCDRKKYYWPAAAMIFILLSVGVSIPLMIKTTEPVVVASKQINRIINQYSAQPEIKVVIHIVKDDPVIVEALLDQAEQLARLNYKLGKPVRVELVANGKGLSVFRNDQDVFRARIIGLINQYDNLRFVACQKTMERIFEKTKKNITLFPGVMIVNSGNEEVALRRQQGWYYLTG